MFSVSSAHESYNTFLSDGNEGISHVVVSIVGYDTYLLRSLAVAVPVFEPVPLSRGERRGNLANMPHTIVDFLSPFWFFFLTGDGSRFGELSAEVFLHRVSPAFLSVHQVTLLNHPAHKRDIVISGENFSPLPVVL